MIRLVIFQVKLGFRLHRGKKTTGSIGFYSECFKNTCLTDWVESSSSGLKQKQSEVMPRFPTHHLPAALQQLLQLQSISSPSRQHHRPLWSQHGLLHLPPALRYPLRHFLLGLWTRRLHGPAPSVRRLPSPQREAQQALIPPPPLLPPLPPLQIAQLQGARSSVPTAIRLQRQLLLRAQLRAVKGFTETFMSSFRNALGL